MQTIKRLVGFLELSWSLSSGLFTSLLEVNRMTFEHAIANWPFDSMVFNERVPVKINYLNSFNALQS